MYPWPGAARTVKERIADAALVHRLTGCCPSVALHIPWDAVDDYAELARYAASEGIRIGAINPNLFGEDEYRLGSLCRPDERVRKRALDHCRECVEIAARLVHGLQEVYALLLPDMRLLVEYKFFEPGFYPGSTVSRGRCVRLIAPGRFPTGARL